MHGSRAYKHADRQNGSCTVLRNGSFSFHRARASAVVLPFHIYYLLLTQIRPARYHNTAPPLCPLSPSSRLSGPRLVVGPWDQLHPAVQHNTGRFASLESVVASHHVSPMAYSGEYGIVDPLSQPPQSAANGTDRTVSLSTATSPRRDFHYAMACGELVRRFVHLIGWDADYAAVAMYRGAFQERRRRWERAAGAAVEAVAGVIADVMASVDAHVDYMWHLAEEEAYLRCCQEYVVAEELHTARVWAMQDAEAEAQQYEEEQKKAAHARALKAKATWF